MLFTTFGGADHAQDLSMVRSFVEEYNKDSLVVKDEGDNALHSLWGEPIGENAAAAEVFPNTKSFTVDSKFM
jgi:hypothetical protein